MKGRCLNRLTKEPYLFSFLPENSPSRTRTYDPTVNSRLLYRLSYRGLDISFNIPSKPHISYRSLSSSFFLSTIPWLCPRPISDSQLHVLPHFHLCPIYLVVFKGSYCFRMGYLILRGASRLDAFSVYPFPAWLPCHALGNATGTPAAGPSRSSRTKDSSSQISYAHAG